MRKSTILLLVLAALVVGSLSAVQAAPNLQQRQVQITSPESNGQVRGVVPVMGSSAIEDFQFYKLEFGVGPNPSQWAILGVLHEQSVLNGQLELWDTTRIPDGVYSLRLQAVKRDGNYDEFFVRQIIVVNTQPTQTPTRAVTITPTTAVPVYSPTPRPTATLQIIAPGAELALPSPTPTLSRPEQTQALDLDPKGWGQSFVFGAAAMGIVFVLLGIVFGVRKLL